MHGWRLGGAFSLETDEAQEKVDVPEGASPSGVAHGAFHGRAGAGVFQEFLRVSGHGLAPCQGRCVLATLGWYLHSIVPESQLTAKIEEYNDYIKDGILAIVALVVVYFVIRTYIKKAKADKK